MNFEMLIPSKTSELASSVFTKSLPVHAGHQAARLPSAVRVLEVEGSCFALPERERQPLHNQERAVKEGHAAPTQRCPKHCSSH